MVQAGEAGGFGGAGAGAGLTMMSQLFLAKMTKLDRLPMDIVSLIFSHCPLIEILARIPMLSKKWN